MKHANLEDNLREVDHDDTGRDREGDRDREFERETGLEGELERELIVSAELGTQAKGIPCDLWERARVSRSRRVGAAALMGVYGEDARNNEDLIARALADELTDEEISDLESMRPRGEAERFGPEGRYGWVA